MCAEDEPTAPAKGDKVTPKPVELAVNVATELSVNEGTLAVLRDETGEGTGILAAEEEVVKEDLELAAIVEEVVAVVVEEAKGGSGEECDTAGEAGKKEAAGLGLSVFGESEKGMGMRNCIRYSIRIAAILSWGSRLKTFSTFREAAFLNTSVFTESPTSKPGNA